MMLCALANAQTPTWLWANSASGNNNDLVKSVTTDVNGNVYTVGSFSSDTLHFGAYTLINSGWGTFDMFVVKYDALGNALWATSAGGSDSDYGSGVTVDTVGNIYVAGSFRSDYITFGSITLTNSGPPYSDFFVVKYDVSGNVVWVNSSKNSISSDASYSICTDGFGNVYYSGPYQSDSITIGTTTLLNPGAPNRDSYIVKYGSSGNVLWVKGIGGLDDDAVNSISTDGNGNLVACGYFFSSSLVLGGVSLLNSSYGTSDLFVVKYDPSGNVIWAKSAGGNDSDYGSSVAADIHGNVFMGGSFRSSTIRFGAITLINSGPPYSDFCLVKYDAFGNVVWANTSKNSVSSDATYSICTDRTGNTFLTGPYQGDSITIGNTTLHNNAAPNRNFYIARYDSLGDVDWAIGLGGNNDDAGYSICIDPSGDLFAGGYFTSPSLNFGSITLTNSGFGTTDLFIGKLIESESPILNTGIDAAQNIVICPNPIFTTAIIQFDPGLNNAEIALYDIFGKKISVTHHFSGIKLDFDKGSLMSGVYFLNIKQGNKSITGKLVIQ